MGRNYYIVSVITEYEWGMLLPITKRWSRFDEETLGYVPSVYGVYELGNRLRNVIYIGSGVLNERLSSHFRSRNPCLQKAYYFRYERTFSEARARSRERALLREYERTYEELPLCNERIG